MKIAYLACALFWLSSAAVNAQILAPREAAQIELGPLSLYPSLRIVDAGIDENVFNDADNPKKDFTFTVASRALVTCLLSSDH